MILRPKIFSFSRPVSTLLLIVLWAFVFSSGNPSTHAAEKGIWLTDEVQAKLGDAFLEEGEYYRAVTDYENTISEIEATIGKRLF